MKGRHELPHGQSATFTAANQRGCLSMADGMDMHGGKNVAVASPFACAESAPKSTLLGFGRPEAPEATARAHVRADAMICSVCICDFFLQRFERKEDGADPVLHISYRFGGAAPWWKGRQIRFCKSSSAKYRSHSHEYLAQQSSRTGSFRGAIEFRGFVLGAMAWKREREGKHSRIQNPDILRTIRAPWQWNVAEQRISEPPSEESPVT